MADYDAQRFYEGLVKHGLIVPTRVPGTFGRSGRFEEVLARFNAMVDRAALPDAADVMHFPPVIDRAILENAGYFDSFPHLAGSIYSFAGKDKQALELSARVHAGKPYVDLQEMTGVSLAPAACYPLYPTLAGVLPANGRTVSLTGWAYRHEPSPEPTRMQSFRVRELIRAGTPEMVVSWRDAWLERGLALLKKLGLPVTTDLAADPFFGRGGRVLADGQKAQKLKFEILVPVISREQPTAVCSFNYHQDKFGQVFEIQSADHQIAHTACLGFGLERCVMALFQCHGFDPADWPKSVLQELWP